MRVSSASRRLPRPIFLLVRLGLGVAFSAPACAPRPPRADPGIPRALAEFRAASVSDVRYDLHFSIPPVLRDTIAGHATIRLTRRNATAPLVLDFTGPRSSVKRVAVSGQTVVAEVRNDHITIPPETLAPGENTIEVDFAAGDGALNRNPDFLYTLFVPDRASSAFPCFDQPDIKARYTLTLEVPGPWLAVANGAALAAEHSDGRTVYRFAETQPLSTYHFAFAAGMFRVDSAERRGRMLHMFHRETDAAKVRRNREAIFDLHDRALAWLEDYTQIPYPFGKFDFLLLPAFQYGGMEHPGAIYYRADGLLLDESATQNQILGRASVIAHETSHMWFGDLVTMRWFNDVWMKEVFANFMAAKIVNPSFPEINHELRFFLAHYPSAYDVDRTAGATPIRQPLENLREAGTLYGPVIYDKAPIVMRQLERLVGAATFRDGLREYLDHYRFANATWDDLVALLDRRSPAEVAAWSRIWVEEAGRPTVRAELVGDGRGAIASLALQQDDPARRGRVWSQQLDVLLFLRDSTASLPVRFASRTATVDAARGLALPLAQFPGAGGMGYALFVLDSASQTHVLDVLPTLPNPLTRGAAWVTLWDALLEGRLAPPLLLQRLLDALPAELDELNAQRMLGYVTDAYWRYLAEEPRLQWAPRVEEVLWNGVVHAPTRTLAAAYFRAFGSTALTPSAVARLRRVWAGRDTVPGVTLSESDFTRLALQLAVRGVSDAESILEEQAARIENPDRQAQFAFVRPAVSAAQSVRDSVFQSFRSEANRGHEPWVLEALVYLNHPLRAQSAEGYILPSLALLQEIQRTGDIFFPGRWLDAALGGHNSPAAAAMVRDYLRRNPDIPARLRNKILQSADPLFRAAAIVRATGPRAP